MQKTFKKIGVAIMALSMFTLSSCDELKDLLNVDFDLKGEAIYIDVEATIPVGESEVLGSETYDKTLAEILDEQGVGQHINKIKEINLTSITIEITAGNDPDNNFQNIQSILAEISADGAAPITVGTVLIPTGATTKLTVPVTNGAINIKDYFSKKNFSYAVKGNVTKEITNDLQLKITANYSFVFSL